MCQSQLCTPYTAQMVAVPGASAGCATIHQGWNCIGAVQILEVLNAAANEGGAAKSRRERADPTRRHTLVTCACAAALAGLDTLARKYRGINESSLFASRVTSQTLNSRALLLF